MSTRASWLSTCLAVYRAMKPPSSSSSQALYTRAVACGPSYLGFGHAPHARGQLPRMYLVGGLAAAHVPCVLDALAARGPPLAGLAQLRLVEARRLKRHRLLVPSRGFGHVPRPHRRDVRRGVATVEEKQRVLVSSE
eukprot:scaffold56491_cov75-Phaeocystis_antarctica.AAC.3